MDLMRTLRTAQEFIRWRKKIQQQTIRTEDKQYFCSKLDIILDDEISQTRLDLKIFRAIRLLPMGATRPVVLKMYENEKDAKDDLLVSLRLHQNGKSPWVVRYHNDEPLVFDTQQARAEKITLAQRRTGVRGETATLQGKPWYAVEMDHYPSTLSDILRSYEARDPPASLSCAVLRDGIAILLEFERHHLIWGDCKPQNLVLSPSTQHLVAIDLGSVCERNPEASTRAVTPLYAMASEARCTAQLDLVCFANTLLQSFVSQSVWSALHSNVTPVAGGFVLEGRKMAGLDALQKNLQHAIATKNDMNLSLVLTILNMSAVMDITIHGVASQLVSTQHVPFITLPSDGTS
jgi:hypothetical protein